MSVDLANNAAVNLIIQNSAKFLVQWSVERVRSARGSRGGGMISVLYKPLGHAFFTIANTLKCCYLFCHKKGKRNISRDGIRNCG